MDFVEFVVKVKFVIAVQFPGLFSEDLVFFGNVMTYLE